MHVHAGLCERRTQIGRPVQAAVDLLHAIASIRNFVIGTEQSAGHSCRRREPISAAAAMVPHRQLAHHPLNDAIEIRSGRQIGKELRVLLSICLPIDAVHVWRVEVVAVDAPCFVEHLRPFGAGIDLHLDRVGGETSGIGLDALASGGDVPVSRLAVEHLLRVRRKLIVVDLGKEHLVAPLGEVVAVEGVLAVGVADVVHLPRFPGGQRRQLGGGDRKGEDAGADAVQIDPHVVGRVHAPSHRRQPGRAAHALECRVRHRRAGLEHARRVATSRITLREHALLVALLRQRIGKILPQHHEVHASRAPKIEVGLCEPVLERAGVGGAEGVQVLSASVENGLRHLAQTVRDRKRLVLIDVVEEERADERLRVHRVGDPPGIRGPREARRIRARRRIELVAANAPRNGGLQVEHVRTLRVVGVSDTLSVRRPLEPGVESVAGELVRLDVALAVLRLDFELVLAARIG